MTKKKKEDRYLTASDMEEKERQFQNFALSLDDIEEDLSPDEIREEAYKRGLWQRPETTVAPSAGYTSGRQNTNPLDLQNQIRRTNTDTIPSIAQRVAAEYAQNKLGYDYLSKYGDNTRYADVSGDISKLESVKGGAARRGKDTSTYDKAIELLKEYAGQKYSLSDTDLSEGAIQDRRDIYNQNNREINKLNSQIEAQSKSKNSALQQWVDYYNNDSNLFTLESNQALIEKIKANTGYDISKEIGTIYTPEELKTKVDEINTYLSQDDSPNVKDLKNRVEGLQSQNAAYERTQKKSDDYADEYRDKAKEEVNDPYGLISGSLHSSNKYQEPDNYYDKVEGANPRFTESGNITQPQIKRYEDAPTVESAYKNIDAHTEMLTSDEKAIYSYLLRNKGQLVAQAYLDEMKDTLQKRASESVNEYIENANGVEKAILLAGSVPMNVYGTVTGFAEDTANILAGKDIHPYSEAHSMYNIAQGTRSTIAEDIDKATGGANIAGFSYGDAFQAAMSIPDFMLGSLTPEFYVASMSMGAAQSRAKELWEEGASYDQIVAESVLSGAAEALFEKVSLDKIIKMAKGGGLKNFIETALKGMFIEGSEEANTEVANIISDIIVRGSQSDWSKNVQKYIDGGYTESEAEALAFGDMAKKVGFSFVGGAIGGAGGSVGVAFNKASGLIQQNQYEKQAGQAVVSNANVDALIDKAKHSGNSSIVAQAKELEQLKQSDNVTEKKLQKETGKLYAALQESTIKNVDESTAKRTEIKRAFTEQLKGDESISDIDKAAEALTKDYFGEKLTRSEKAIVSTGAAQEAQAAIKENESILTEQAKKNQNRAFADYLDTHSLTQAQEKVKEAPIDTSDYHISAENANYYDGDFVNVKNIASVGADNITVNLDNGKTAKVKEMDLASEDDAIIYQAIIDIQKSLGQPISTDLANEIFHGYDSGVYKNAADYILGVRDAIEKGYSNETLMRADDSAAVLAPTAREVFYKAGRNIALGNTEQRQSNIKAQPTATGKGSVSFEGGSIEKVLPRLNGRRRVAVDMMTGLAEAKGLDVVFFESTKDGKGRWNSKYANAQTGDTGAQSPNGFYKNGKIYIDINSGTNGQGLILFTASHELVHMIREYSPEMYQELADFLVEKYNQKGISVRTLVLREMAKSTNLNYDEALEEVIANSCESFLRDVHLNDKAAELYRSKPTLANKIRDYLHDLLSRLKKWYAGLTPQSVEGRTVAAMRDEIQHAHDLFVQGINQASQNRLNATPQNLRNMEKPAGEGGVKLQGRGSTTFNDNDNSESKEILRITEENISKVSDKQIFNIDKDFVFKSNNKSNDIFNYFASLGGIAVNPQYGIVELSKSGSKSTVFHGFGREKLASIYGIKDTIENGTVISYTQNYKNKGYDRFIVCGKGTLFGNKETYLSVVIKSYPNNKKLNNKFYLHEVLLMESTKETDSPIMTGTHNSENPVSESVSKNSISQTEQDINTSKQKNQSRSTTDVIGYKYAVKNGDMEKVQRIVDRTANRAFADSKVRGKDGKLRKVYHYTNTDFYSFDTGRSGKNQGQTHGDGIYISTSPDEFSYAGKKRMTLYANITNPFEMNLTADQARDVLEKYAVTKHNLDKYDGLYRNHAMNALQSPIKVFDYLKEYADDNGIKVSDILRDLGFDGVHDGSEWVAFSSEQLKSAEPVTYDDNGDVVPLSERFNTEQKDIRYQSRDEDFDLDFLFDDDDSIESTFAKEYATHHEDIGEVLRNIADIDIEPKKVASIVSRVLRDNLGSIDAKARELLSTELQIALDRVSRENPETVVNEMIDAVRKAVSEANAPDERAEANYKDLLTAFKGRKFYLTDEQINQLAEHDMTLNDLRKKLFPYGINIVSRENAKRSIDGGFTDASEFSLEGLYDMLESPEEFLPYKREEWDEYGYDAPYIVIDTLSKLRDMREQSMSDMYSDEDIDDLAIALTAKITGGIVEEKYKTKYNGKDSAQIRQALKDQQKQTDDYIAVLVDTLTTKHEEQLAEQQEKNRQKLAELKQKERDRAEKREKQLREKYREQRARGYESRKRTELRGKIRRLMNRFESRLTKPRDGSYVPRELISQTVDILNAINMDSGRSTRLSEKIAVLRNTYDGLKKDAQAFAVYNDTISAMLSNLVDALGDTAIMDMSLDQLSQTYDTLRSLDHYIRESVKMTDTDEKRTAHALGREMIAETRAVPKAHSGILSGYIQTQLRPDVMFNRLAGFKKNSVWSQMARMLDDGQLHMTQLQMEFSKIFADVLTDVKQLRTLSDTKHLVDIGLVDDNGNKVPITRGMMLSLYMHLQNEDNVRHVMGGGLTVPGIREYYKGDVTKAFGKGQRSVRVGMLDNSEYPEGIKSAIEKQLTDYEKLWIGYAHEFFNVASRNAINDTTMKLYHFKKANVDNYFPIHTDSNYRAASFESITRDMSLENSGFMKERIKASNPILLEDIVDVINDQIQKVSKYCGLTIPINNFQKVYGTTLSGFETSLQKEINKKFSGSRTNTSATKYIDNLITDLTSGRQTSDGPTAKFFNMARGNLAAATLTLNVRVAIAQAASYPTAAAEIGWKPLMKAFARGGKSNRMISRADRAAIEEVSPLLWLRTQGYSNTEIGDIKELRKQKHQIEGKFKKALGWIEFFDGMTVGRLFYAAQYYVDDNYPTLKRGSEEYKQKVAEVYNNVVEKTQPNYTVMQRPDILRNPNALVKSLTMFMTQRLQNFNIVYDAVGTYNKYRDDFKAGKNGVTAKDLREAKTKLSRAVVSQTVAAIAIVGMKLFADMLMHSMNGYRDKDDELTAKGVSLALLDNFADTVLGSVLFGSDLYSLFKSALFGKRYYGISLSGVDSFTEALTNIVNLRKGITLDSANKAATSICQLMGIPLNNAEKIVKAIYYWGSDFSEGSFMEAGVKRTNKQNIHRAEMRYTNGDTSEAKQLLNAMLEQKVSEGKTEKEAKSWLRSQLTSTYKQRYLQAVKDNNNTERASIRQFLYQTGAYGSLNDLDKTFEKWVKDSEKKEK